MTNQPSNWQQNIEGEWHGNPSVFDPEGNHTGFIKVYRSSVFEDGVTTYFMNTVFDNDGPLRSRFETVEFAFGLDDADTNRIYLGPDFYGAGHPYGSLVDAHYYSPAWRADLRTMVHVLADQQTQVYSSLLFDGPSLIAVFNGVYKVAFDYHTNPDTQQRIDAHCAAERVAGRRSYAVPSKIGGTWSGVAQWWGADQSPRGEIEVSIVHEPITLLRARQRISLRGAIARDWTVERYRDSNRTTFDGPDAYGNAIAYGRASYGSLHITRSAEKLQTRDFLFDEANTLSVNWKFFDGDQLDGMLFGELHWTPAQ